MTTESRAESFADEPVQMVEDMTDMIEHRMLTYEQQKCLQTYRSEFLEMYSKVDDDFSI